MNDSSFWSITVPRVLSSYAVLTFTILWVGFAIALIVNPEWLDLLWNWVQALPSVLNILAWVFITPLMGALWIWESSWTTIIRLLAFAGIGGWTILAVSGFLKAVRQIRLCSLGVRTVYQWLRQECLSQPIEESHELKSNQLVLYYFSCLDNSHHSDRCIAIWQNVKFARVYSYHFDLLGCAGFYFDKIRLREYQEMASETARALDLDHYCSSGWFLFASIISAALSSSSRYFYCTSYSHLLFNQSLAGRVLLAGLVARCHTKLASLDIDLVFHCSFHDVAFCLCLVL